MFFKRIILWIPDVFIFLFSDYLKVLVPVSYVRETGRYGPELAKCCFRITLKVKTLVMFFPVFRIRMLYYADPDPGPPWAKFG